MWTDFKKIREQEERLLYTILTHMGGYEWFSHWVRWKEQRTIIGIHKGKGRGNRNRGIRIIEEVLRNIQGWMK